MSMVCFAGMVQHGAGRYPADVKEEWREGLLYWTYILGFFLVTGISLVKISIGFLLKRFAQSPGQHRLLWGMIELLSAFMVYSAITFSITCVPLRANWIPRLRAAPTTKCQSRPVLSIIGTVNGVINALTDVIFCLLPIPVLLSLRINRRTRTTLFLILSLGLFIFIKLLKGASTAVHPSGDTSRYGYGYGPTDRPKTCHCGEPQYSWSVQDRGPNYLPREILQIPLDSVVVSSGHGDIGGDNGGDRNNDPRSHYEAQVCSSSGGVRHYACEREQREE
ncbi:hypothetical protein PG988_003364 [Apiospora saccharicola]